MAWPVLLWAAILSAVPVLVLAACAALGTCPIPVACGTALLTIAIAYWAVACWNADIAMLAETARRAGRSAVIPPMPSSLPASDEARYEIGRLAGQLSDRATLIETLLGAEEAIVELLPDPLILLGADRVVRRANVAARRAFGPDIAAVLRHPSLRGAIEQASGEGAGSRPPIDPVDLALLTPVTRDVLATVIGLDPKRPGGGRVLVVLSDRTRDRAIERTRSDFIANASHELRTPLASLIGFIETLRGPAADDPPAQRRFLEIMAEQAARMNRLLDDLLSLSRIEISEHRAPDARVDTASVLARVAAAFELRVAARGQRLTMDVPSTLPTVLADEDQLVQVIENLLDNALKYGREAGRITISAEPEQGGTPQRSGVTIAVGDDGPGIAPAHLPRLTERFYRATAGQRRGPAGTGLGLAIVKHIVNRHRGTLRIASREGEGTVFRVWLPEG